MKEKQKNIKPNVEEKSSGLTPRQKNWLYTGLFIIVVGIFFIVNNSGESNEQGPYPPGYNPNPVKVIKLSDYKGKVVLVDFWATWCPPCRKGIPDLIELKNKYSEKGFEIIGISLDAVTRGGKTKNDVSPFIKDYKINYPVVEGLTKTTQDFGGFQTIPTSFIIDKEGNIVESFEGLASITDYEKIISKALAGNVSTEKVAPDFELKEIK